MPDLIPVRRLATLCGVAAFIVAAASPALAESVPSNAGIAASQARQSQATAPLPQPAAPIALPQLVEPQLQLDAKEKLLIKHVTVDGDQPLGDPAVRAIVASYEGRPLSMADIYEMADRLTNFYRGKGYLVAKTYVPAQDAKAGTLHLKLVAGRWGAVTVKNQSLVNDTLVKGTIDKATIDRAVAGDGYIESAAIEHAMLAVGDLAGAGVPKAAIAAGKAPGTSDFTFDVPADKRIGGSLVGDNWGGPSTGRQRLSGDVYLNSPLGLGDKLDLYGLVSNESELLNGRAAYSLPVLETGLRAEAAVFRTTYTLGQAYSALDASGVAEGGTLTLTYALQRQQASSLYLSLAGTFEHLRDDVLGAVVSERHIALGTLAVSHEGHFDLAGHALTTSAGVSGTFGHVGIDSASGSTAAAGDYGRGNLNLGAALGLGDGFSLAGTVRGQTSFGRTLDSSEQFGLTGPWGVRSYDEGVTADSGVIFTPELRYQLPEIQGLKHQLSVFSDLGVAWLASPDPTGLQTQRTSVEDIGLGYSANREWMAGRSLFVRAEMAWSIGSAGTAAAERYGRGAKGLFQLGTTF